MEKLAANLFGFILTFVIGIPFVMLWGVVLSDMWNWFLVPALALPVIGMKVGVGLRLLTAAATMRLLREPKDESETHWFLRALGRHVMMGLAALLFWGMAWVYFNIL